MEPIVLIASESCADRTYWTRILESAPFKVQILCAESIPAAQRVIAQHSHGIAAVVVPYELCDEHGITAMDATSDPRHRWAVIAVANGALPDSGTGAPGALLLYPGMGLNYNLPIAVKGLLAARRG